MRRLTISSSFRSSILTALAVLVASGSLSACRLGANNSEKLSALKSGEIYDEDGILSVEISSPVAGTLINLASNSSAYAVSGTCSPDGSPITLLIDQSPLAAAAEVSCADGQWTSSFDSTALGDGAHTLLASISRNGKSTTSSEITFTKNVAVPQLAILSPSNNGFINASTDSATFALSGSCTENGQNVTVTVDDASATAQNGGTCNGSTWAATISTLPLAAGAHTLKVSIQSASGNAKTSDPIVVAKDILAPTSAIGTPSNNSYVNLGNNSASFAVSGTCNDSTASVQVKVDGANTGTAAPCGGANWNATISTVALSQGVHSLTAQITDPAGNSAASSAITVTKDTSAPAIAITSPTASSSINIGNNSASFAIQGSCTTATENGRTVTIQVNGSNATQSAIACGASDSWSGTINTTALAQGSHTLTALLADAAGNSSTSTGVSLTKDTSAPTVTLTSPSAGVVIHAAKNSTTYPIRGTCSENSRTVAIFVDGSTASSLASNTCSSGAFAATIDTTGLSAGAHTITATQADAAGNTGPSTPPSAIVTYNMTLNLGATFTRTSTAFDPVSGVQAASGAARYTRLSGATGVMNEEATTNLAANSSFETDTDADGRADNWTPTFGSGVSVTTSRVASNVFNGAYAQRLDLTAVTSTPTSTTLHRIYQGSIAVTPGTAYTLSAYLTPSAGSGFATLLQIEWYQGATFLSQASNTGALTGGQTTRAVVTGTAPANATTANILVGFTRPSNTSTTIGMMDIDAVQFEAKAYATSWTDSTRNIETLTVPTAGNVMTTEGAVVVRAYVDANMAATTPTRAYHLFFHTYNGNKNHLYIARENLGAGYRWLVLTSKNDYPTSSYSAATWNGTLTAGWHIFAAKWTAGALELWVDGTQQATTPTPNLPGQLGSVVYVGSNGGGVNWNQPIDYAAFYQQAPTDAEMTTYTTSGPLNADNLLDFAGASFGRESVANETSAGVQAASGAPRYATANGKRGLLIEEGTTNLLTAQQSSIETDASGFVNGTGVTIARITNWSWTGTAAMSVLGANSFSSTTNYYLQTANTLSFTSGVTYAGSAYVHNPNASAITVSGGFSGSNSGSVILQPGETKRLTWTQTAASTAMTSLRLIEATGQLFYVDGLQAEQKNYVTSWQIGGTTRALETLTIPTAGLFTPGNWTAAFDFTPTTTQRKWGAVWTLKIDNNNFYGLYIPNTDGKPYLEIKSGGTTYGTYQASTTPELLEGTKYRLVIKGNGSQMKIWLNGSPIGFSGTTYAEPVGTLPALMYIGGTSGSNWQPNAVFDAAYFFNAAQDDSVITGWGASGEITGATLKLGFDNSLGQ